MKTCLAVNIRRTFVEGYWYVKFDIYDENKSKLINNINISTDPEVCSYQSLYEISNYLQRKNPDHVTIITDWIELIKGTYEDYNYPPSEYFKRTMESINYIIINVFDSELIEEFYSN